MLRKVTICCCGLLLPAVLTATSTAAQDLWKPQEAPGRERLPGSVELPNRRLASKGDACPDELPAKEVEGDQSIVAVTAEKARRLSDLSLDGIEKGGQESPRRLAEEGDPLERSQVGIVVAAESAKAPDQPAILSGADHGRSTSQSPPRRLAKEVAVRNIADPTEVAPEASLRHLHHGNEGETKQHGDEGTTGLKGSGGGEPEGGVAAKQLSSESAGTADKNHSCGCQHSKKGLRNLSALRGSVDAAAAIATTRRDEEAKINGPSSRRLSEELETPAQTEASPPAAPESTRRLSDQQDVLPGSPGSGTATRRLLDGEVEKDGGKGEDEAKKSN